MLNTLPPLLALLSLLSGSSAQLFGSCDYTQEVVPGNEYYIFNSNFPDLYRPATSCRWVAKSDRPLQLTCNPFELPASFQCIQDALIVQDALPGAVGHRYCGNGSFSFVSQSNQLTVTLVTSILTQGGRFSCTVSTVPKADETACECGWTNPARIVGGMNTGVNEFPMMAGLVDASQGMVFCGATIINQKQVLTAAHCVATRTVSQLGVLVGDHDLSTGSETNATRLFRVDSIQVHPQYNINTDDYDIALVTIRGTITFSQAVGPVCLPFQHYPDTFAGNFIDVLGWGSTEFGGPTSNILQKAQLAVITNAQCRRFYNDLTNRQLCTFAEGRDSCQFDSGGPVLWQNPATRRVVEIGIIALGGVCALDEPATNTRVGAFMDWIVSNTPAGITYCTVE